MSVMIHGMHANNSFDPPNPVTVANVKVGNALSYITWTDPEDDGEGIGVWKSTRVVRKAGSAPANESDGTVVLSSGVKNQYATTEYIDTGLINGVTYYYGFFACSKDGVYAKTGAIKSVVPQAYKTYGIKIDTTNSNPDTAVTYTDTVHPEAKSADWDDFFGIYPCLFKNGSEVGRLNPDNFAQFEDGSSADITSGSAGDVMIAFPRRGINIYKSGNYLYVYVTDDPNKEGFSYLAHQRGSVEKDVFYLGAYKGYTSSSKLRSLSGKSPTVSTTLTNFRTYAQANGSGYELSAYAQLVYRQALYLVKYKNMNSQSAVGQGYVGGSSAQTTGATNTNGMNYGSTSTTSRVKVFGLEDFWGNVREWVDGMFCNSSYHVLIGTDNFNNSATGYTDYGACGITSNTGVYPKSVVGTNEVGFFPNSASGGSSSTYYSDYAYVYADVFAVYGGRWSGGSSAGAFCLRVLYAASESDSDVGARLMFL